MSRNSQSSAGEEIVTGKDDRFKTVLDVISICFQLRDTIMAPTSQKQLAAYESWQASGYALVRQHPTSQGPLSLKV
jgi:hypothetical protein